MEEPMIVAFARLIGESFPQLGGRSIAVSEVDAFKAKTNLPSLPIAYSALLAETSDQAANGSGVFNIKQTILLQFMFEPERYKTAEGGESPFFAFYDYEAIRNQLLSATVKWRTPRGASLAYRSLDVESDEMAVYITFKFETTERYQWGDDCYNPKIAEAPRPITFTVSANMCYALSNCSDAEEVVKDPCGT